MLTIAPNDLEAKAARAFVEVDWKADTGPLHQLIDEIRTTNPAAMPQLADLSLLCALAERDVAAAKDALLASGEFPLGRQAVNFTRPFVEGVIARMTNDEHNAQLAFTAARAEQEKTVQAQPNYGPAWCVLGVIDAALGRKEDALREGRRAVELLPVEKDPVNGMVMIKYLAMIAAWVGEKDLACEQLAAAVRCPTSGMRPQLWRIETDAVVGSAARRPALRKNRRLSRAEVIPVVAGVPPAFWQYSSLSAADTAALYSTATSLIFRVTNRRILRSTSSERPEMSSLTTRNQRRPKQEKEIKP